MNSSKTFDQEYQNLNPAQTSAVNQIDGTVLVVAGPGTGKTQLLAMRVANILRQTDASASSILCLTFTESAAANMTERLARIIGADAYKVAVHTFHSFGSEIISHYPAMFYNGALFRPSDELAASEILREILAGLPHDNPLSATMNGEFTYLSDVSRAISDFRNAGLSPKEAREILQQNLDFCREISDDFRETFAPHVDKKTILAAEDLLKAAQNLIKDFPNFAFAPEPTLAEIFTNSLRKALDEATELGGKTTPLSNFKKSWATLDSSKNLILKDAKNSEKLLAAVGVYETYEQELLTHNLYDFDDMILRVRAAIDQNPELKFDLQEHYQYILVDEFQDTNGAQMRLLSTLTDYDDAPNLMVVGDDDQAIYRFQGADVSNIQQFMARYSAASVITLTENYRSQSEVLNSAEKVSSQISERLANDEKVDKALQQKFSGKGKVERVIAENREQENAEVAQRVKSLISSEGLSPKFFSKDFPPSHGKTYIPDDTDRFVFAAKEEERKDGPAGCPAYDVFSSDGSEEKTVSEKADSKSDSRNKSESDTLSPSIAIIARKHSDLEQLLPFLDAQNISYDYERRQSVLDSPPVEQLVLLARIIDAIAARNDAEADALLPQLLSFPAWQISPLEIWKLSLAAKKSHKFWLEQMLLQNEQTRQIAEWLIVMSARSQNEPLESMLDELFGTPNFSGGKNPPAKTLILSESTKISEKEISKTLAARENDFTSPLFNYFFDKEKLQQNPGEYLDFLSALSMLRNKLKSWRPEQKLALIDFLDFVQAAADFRVPLTATRYISGQNPVQLLTAHKAKGLEFDVVFIINATSQRWGAKSRAPSDKLPAPHNLHLKITGDNDDERLRLLFVAMTRARRQLIVSSAANDGEKTLLPIEYLLNIKEEVLPPSSINSAISEQSLAWHAPLVTVDNDLRTALSETLSKYKLSATHLNNFLDLSRGNPQMFLLRDLLRFPEAKSPAAAFGTAVHLALQNAHTHLAARGALKPLEDVLGDFQNSLDDADLNQRDRDFYLKKGLDILSAFYNQRSDTFSSNQRAEYSSIVEIPSLNNVRLAGKIDLIDFDKANKTLQLTDYKTSKPTNSWQGKTDYEKIKLRGYRRQLLFYKLLIENSREFADWKVQNGVIEFVEPNSDSQIARLEIDYSAPKTREELADFTKLLLAVWTRIMNLDLPDTTEFSPNLAGILEFEKYLVEGGN